MQLFSRANTIGKRFVGIDPVINNNHQFESHARISAQTIPGLLSVPNNFYPFYRVSIDVQNSTPLSFYFQLHRHRVLVHLVYLQLLNLSKDEIALV